MKKEEPPLPTPTKEKKNKKKTKIVRVTICICDIFTGPILSTYQISVNYLSQTTRGDNKEKQTVRATILVHNLLSKPIRYHTTITKGTGVMKRTRFYGHY